MSTYAIISVGGKQYRVREGETLLVDRLKHGAGNSFAHEIRPPAVVRALAVVVAFAGAAGLPAGHELRPGASVDGLRVGSG